ncbi:carbohydrate kinase [Bacillaceae bacterium Marseille-Q3522]|nr:carbohydrate kinase [Bacillaceae bacterium Marseille-Q3522]
MKYIIGIDAGTSYVKAVLFDTQGNEIMVQASENEPIYLGKAEVEQDMNVLWEKVALCIKMIMEKGPASANDILGIGVTGQGEGCWLIDEIGDPVQNAILWCDGRATDEVAEVTVQHPEIRELIYNTTGTPPLTGTQLMLLKWMHNHRKDVLDKASTIFFCKDWVRYKLTGKVNGDLTDAGTSLLDSAKGTVSYEILKALGLEEYKKYIPQVVTSNTIVGGLQKDVALKLGLRSDTPVIAGSIDVVACAVGLGAVNDNDVCVILGTTCANEIIKRKNQCRFGEQGTRYEKHAVGDLFLNLLPTMNGTPNIDWVLNEIALTKDFAKIDKLIENVRPGSGGVIYHPYVSAAGERAPFYHPHAKAGFFGIGTHTTRADLIRAVYEGISFSIKDCLQGVNKNGRIYIAGGGAKSSVWVQMISDVIGMEVVVSDGNEFAAKGAAMMLGTAVGIYQNYDDAAAKICNVKLIYFPNHDENLIYEKIYQLYKKIRTVNEPLWTSRAEIMKAIG